MSEMSKETTLKRSDTEERQVHRGRGDRDPEPVEPLPPPVDLQPPPRGGDGDDDQ